MDRGIAPFFIQESRVVGPPPDEADSDVLSENVLYLLLQRNSRYKFNAKVIAPSHASNVISHFF